MMAIFTDIFEDVTKQGTKIPTNLYLECGLYPIIDQGQSEIAGYTNETQGLFTDVPAIIFGDHTRIIKYVETPCFLGADGVKLLKAKDPHANYKYLYYALCHADIPNTGYNRHFKWLKEVDIREYTEQEQEHIVSQLERIDRLILLRKQQLSKLDELVKARFVEVFGDAVKNDMRWESKPLNEVCEGIGDGLHGTPVYDDGGEYPFINGNNLIDGKIVITPATKMVSKETYMKHIIDISTNAILISINGTLGKLAFYNGEKVMLGKSACYCNLKQNINKLFVYGVMKSDSFAEFLDNSSTKSTIKNVGLKAMREYKLILPPTELQEQFAAFVEQTDKSKSEIQKSLEKLETLKKALMQKYFG